MPINAGAIGIQPVQPQRPTSETEGIQRRDDGTSGGFRPQTTVALKTAIEDLAGTLSKISSQEKFSMARLPQDIGQVVRNIMQQSFSLSATLSQGIGSTIESQRFSNDQLMILARMLSQIGALAERGFSMELSDETKTLLAQFKNLIVAESGGNFLEPVLMSKSAFELIDSKNPEQLPQALYEILAQLSQPVTSSTLNQPQQSEGMQFLNQLVKFFMPRPSADTSTAQNQSQQQQNQNPQMQQRPTPTPTQRLLNSMYRQLDDPYANLAKQQAAANRAPQNFQPDTPKNATPQQNLNQPSNQNSTPQNMNQPTNQNSTSQNMNQPSNQNATPQNLNQPSNQNSTPQNLNQLSNQNATPQNMNQPTNQNSTPQNLNQPSNQNATSQNLNQPSNQNATPQNLNQLSNQNATPQNMNHPSNQNSTPQQNLNQPSNQNATPQNMNHPSNQNSTSQNMNQPSNQNATSQNLNQPSNQNSTPQNLNQSSNQNSTSQNLNQSSNQNSTPQNLNQPSNQNATPQNLNQPLNQNATPQNMNQPSNQNSTPQNLNQPSNQNATPQNLNQPSNQNATPQNLNQPPKVAQQFQTQNQSLFRESSPVPNENFLSKQLELKNQMQDAKNLLLKQPMQNTSQTMDTMKSLAQFLIKNSQTMTPRDSTLLQNFVNNTQQMLPEAEARHLQNLLRLCQQNVPAVVQQAAVQHKLPDLPRLWAFMQLCDMAALPSQMTPRAFKRAGREVSDFANAMRNFTANDNSTVQNQRSFQMMMPLYLGENSTSYPTYLSIYDENNKDPDTGVEKKETWLRICVLTDNIGAAELIFRVYEGNQLDMRFYFSEIDAAEDFRSYISDLRSSIRETKFNIGEIRIGSIGERMLAS